MSYIPNCREDETYNPKYLSKEDKAFIRGYDWAVEKAINNFFDNHFENNFADDDYLTHILCQKLPQAKKTEYEMENSFTESGEIEYYTQEVETYADYLRMMILDWCETERNETVVFLVEDMDEDEYNANVERVNKQKASREKENGSVAEADGRAPEGN